ncbi:MAG: MraY family glycosyltransferase, partial [Dehalococcoidia bacterium]
MSAYATTLPTAVLVGGALSGVATWVIRGWSNSHGFVDLPGGRKAHARPVALGGGIAVTLGVIVPVIAAALAAKLLAADCPGWIPAEIAVHLDGILAKAPTALAIVGATAVICVLGLVDDLRPLAAWIKLLVQLAVALFLVVGCDLRLLAHLGWGPSVFLSTLWIVTLINALNLLDNTDGLAAGVALIAAAVFGCTSMLAGQLFVPTWCCLLVGALGGFLPYNIHPASVYLGDAGSMVIGLLLAVLTILTTFADPTQGQQPIGVIAPLVVMAVPLYDT